MRQFFKDLLEYLIMVPYWQNKYGTVYEWPGSTRKRYKREIIEAHKEGIRLITQAHADKEIARLREALEKIKEGGVALGVQAGVTERMLKMCEIADEVLKGTE